MKEYLEKMKEYNNIKLNSDECEIHNRNNRYICYCFDCNRHLCKECLETRSHINHIKKNIIEIKPMDEELDIIKEVINDYKNNIEKLKREKQIKINKLKISFNEKEKYERHKYNLKNEINFIRKEKELKLNNDKYLMDINEILKKYNKEIKKRKDEYIDDNNIICNKYKLMIDKEFIIYNNRIKKIFQKYDEENKNIMLKYDEKIYNTYNIYNNNYYNAININSIFLSYTKNEHIKNNILKRILTNKYDQIYEIIQRIKEDNTNIKKKKKKIIKNYNLLK